jgi:hypothetical protein
VSAPQPPRTCPDWCTTSHSEATGSGWHQGCRIAVTGVGSTAVVQFWNYYDDEFNDPQVAVTLWTGDRGSFYIDNTAAVRSLAELLSWGTDPRQAEMAKALRGAADELDRITGSST